MVTLYDNHDISYTEMFNEFQNWCDLNGKDKTLYTDESNEFFEWLNEELSIELDDLFTNIKYSEENIECVVLGYVGRWNGRFEIEPKRFNTLIDAINACISNCDYFIITENDGIIDITSIHHDASNSFSIHKLNKRAYNVVDNKKLEKDYYHTKYKITF